jgi:hypothetical protein
MIKLVLIGVAAITLAVGVASFELRTKPEWQPDFDHAHGAFVCQNTPLYSMCKTKAGVLPIAWQRYGRND